MANTHSYHLSVTFRLCIQRLCAFIRLLREQKDRSFEKILSQKNKKRSKNSITNNFSKIHRPLDPFPSLLKILQHPNYSDLVHLLPAPSPTNPHRKPDTNDIPEILCVDR